MQDFRKLQLWQLNREFTLAIYKITAGFRFFQIAFSSATELLHQLITSLDLDFISREAFARRDRDLEVVRRKLASLMRKLRPV